VFAYQFTAGLEYPVTKRASLDLTYRYLATADPDFGPTEAEYSTHNFTAGVRLYF
jgi:opacity protein-like surface antigen